jgi:CBS domain-containing protein
MQTAAIPYRVADFLKQHPPFQYMDEADLVAFAARGRVKFHEPDEYLCWQSSAHGPFIFVIQQGSVSLWDEKTQPPTLADIRGVGDIIGIERFNGSPTSLFSAKSASEVVVYALPAAEFEPLLKRYAHAAEYITATSAATTDYQAGSTRKPPHEVFLADLVRDRAPLQCAPSASIQEAAALLKDSAAQALALTDEGKVTAILTAADFLRWIASGASDPSQSVSGIATEPLLTVAPQTLVSDAVLAIAEQRTSAAALTTDGSPETPLQTIVTSASLAPAFGDQPVQILQDITSASRIELLRAAHERARTWILEYLAGPAALDWLATFADLVNRRVVERLLQLTGGDAPDMLWCFWGAAGRQELLTAMTPKIAVIGRVPPDLESALAEVGYLAPKAVSTGSLEEWKARFSGWIRDPIRTQVYHSRPVFDLRAFHGPVNVFRELEDHVRTELAAEPGFLRLLANDCFSNLPPLTFFRDLVVEESGEQTDKFRLEHSALLPLADVARVFSLAAGAPLGASTRARFEKARHLLPAKEQLFREAAETMRIVLFHQARAGLRLRSNGSELPLSILSRYDRQVLKRGFRSIHNLLEFTAQGDWLDAL